MTLPEDERAAWRDVRVCVAGLAVSGQAMARVLAQLGARVTVLDARDGEPERLRAQELAPLGVEVRLGGNAVPRVPRGTEVVFTSPGWRPDHPLLLGATSAGLPVWGEVELAWRMRDPTVPWLGVTGTNGKTTTVQMLTAMLAAAGHRAVAAGNVGLPLLDAVLADPPYTVIAAELSSYQLHWSESVQCHAAAVLNVATDHIDWHGSFEAYAAAKAKIWKGASRVIVNADDASACDLAQRYTAKGQHSVAFTLRDPEPGQLGVRDGKLLDAALGDAQVLAEVSDVRPEAPHNVANALAAAGLARTLRADVAHGVHRVSPTAVRDGLHAFRPDAHRITPVATVAGVTYIDDSKATNPHAATASLQAHERVVWIAGGLAKGAGFDELVAAVADRLVAVVLLGRDRHAIAESLERHARNVPVVQVPGVDTGAMDDVVRVAAGFATFGDTVLLAPACASMDMFTDYAERGDVFAAAVRRLAP